MSATLPSRSRFGEKLRRELDQRGMSIRKLARTMNPIHPEQSRRNLARWIGGYNQPSRIQLVALCEALGVPLETFDDDDEEADPVVALMAAIRRVVRDEMARAEEMVK
jgi:transcriptional regulator with XRE-family HTH domain